MNLIAIGHKKQHGKDTVGLIIQEFLPNFKIKKFADTPKKMLCELLGCFMGDWERESFKNQELGEEYTRYYVTQTGASVKRRRVAEFGSLEDAKKSPHNFHRSSRIEVSRMTHRELLVSFTTGWGRETIHPHIWSNTMFKDYKTFAKLVTVGLIGSDGQKGILHDTMELFPEWVVTDLRFKSEAREVKKRGGICIKVFNPRVETPKEEHYSETELDDYQLWDEVIINDGSLEDLKEKVKEMLIRRKVIDA